MFDSPILIVIYHIIMTNFSITNVKTHSVFDTSNSAILNCKLYEPRSFAVNDSLHFLEIFELVKILSASVILNKYR